MSNYSLDLFILRLSTEIFIAFASANDNLQALNSSKENPRPNFNCLLYLIDYPRQIGFIDSIGLG